MRLFSLLAVLALSLLTAPFAFAQDGALTTPELTTSGEAYLDAIRRQRIDSDVAYFDPTAAAPALTTQERLAAVEEPGRNSRSWDGPGEAWPFGLVAAIILVAVILIFVRFGGNIGIMLQPSADNPHAARRGPRHARSSAADVQPRNLSEITGMADRRAALVALAQNALRKAVTANGVLLRQSWTDREALRRLPADQRHLSALRDLIRASERVQFGGRDVTEPEFAHHVTQITPLFRELAT
ncbi:DUF4129 domain-containing protein [Roseobacter sp. CCS2]|uniref:DUF4129 domain-containing protein n=1 Tax=Roseobacter sp. CCS2 TaxID=391593 RepID=UPI0000F3F0B8|nr:DUF4129 domain-containing protein [Roseobacter sp. CCS2]EBA11116.1 hypothetical protein RCCS2_10105 [Roseobacter sp. CCS2]